MFEGSGRANPAIRAAVGYAVAALLWILFSDAVVALWTDRPELIQTAKGLGFVAVTAGVLYLYLRRWVRLVTAHERALRQTSEQLTRANASKSEMIASIGHDLRQPLQSLSLLHSLLTAEDLSPAGRRAITLAEETTARMGVQLLSILDLARLDLGKAPVKIVTFDLGELLGAVAEEMKPLAEAKGLTIRVVPTSRSVRSDPVLLLSMIRNLVANAIKYTEQGRILIGCRRAAGKIRIVVCDTGIGIDEKKQRYIFEEFYQVGNRERDYRMGLGLGLAIVDRMARMLACRIELRSTAGRGSCFCIVIGDGTSLHDG